MKLYIDELKGIQNVKHLFTQISLLIEEAQIDYSRTLFFLPRIYCKSGFSISLQCNYESYCKSTNGYRKLGLEWKTVEFGYPSSNEPLLHEYAEDYGYDRHIWDDNTKKYIVVPFDPVSFDVTGAVGQIPLKVIQKVFDSHNGIDWDKTLSEA